MATLIQRVAQAACRTFSKDVKDYTDTAFQESIASLRSLLNHVTASDVNFDKDLVKIKENVPVEDEEAPVTYVHLWDDEVFSMGIFVLKTGARLPLHDHPGMFGFCKVIHGSIGLKSYSHVELEGLGHQVTGSLAQLRQIGVVREAVKHIDSTVSAGDQCVVLTPSNGNIHEIKAESGPAAFLDVLAPPYDERRGTRLCHYFHDAGPISGTNGGYVWLKQVPQPIDYWCDSSPYLGPSVNPYEDRR